MEQGYIIEVSSKHDEWWRYNVAVMCEERDEAGKRLDVKGIMDEVAEVAIDQAHELKERPKEIEPHRKVILESAPCHSIRLFVNIIPHSLPLDKMIDNKTKFTAKLLVKRGSQVVSESNFEVNVWGGTTVDIVI